MPSWTPSFCWTAFLFAAVLLACCAALLCRFFPTGRSDRSGKTSGENAGIWQRREAEQRNRQMQSSRPGSRQRRPPAVAASPLPAGRGPIPEFRANASDVHMSRGTRRAPQPARVRSLPRLCGCALPLPPPPPPPGSRRCLPCTALHAVPSPRLLYQLMTVRALARSLRCHRDASKAQARKNFAGP